jgi:hypothetical protein
VQPYATIVTKDYPGDGESHLDDRDRWRVNVHVGRARFTELTRDPPDDVARRDFSLTGVIMPHPVYGSLGWIAVVNPGERTTDTLLELLRAAPDDEQRRVARRQAGREDPPV